MAQQIDIRRNEKLVFSNNVETYKFDVSPDGNTVTVTLNLVEPLPQPDPPAHDIDEIHARLAAEAAQSDEPAEEEPAEDAPAETEGEGEEEPAKKRSSRARS